MTSICKECWKGFITSNEFEIPDDPNILVKIFCSNVLCSMNREKILRNEKTRFIPLVS